MLSDILAWRDIGRHVTRSAFEKALAYKAQKRVTAVKISDDLKHVRARVRGSGSQVYQVDIVLELMDGKVSNIVGDCNCPVGKNCKHVAATLLEALSQSDPTAVAAPTAASTPAPSDATKRAAPALPYAVGAWIETVGKAARGDDYPADMAQRLLYALKPVAPDLKMPHLAVSLLSVRLLKGGAFSDIVSRLTLSGFVADQAPTFYRDADIEIIALLRRQRGFFGVQYAYDVGSTALLQALVATGRAYWLDYKRPPLRWAEPRKGRIEWRPASVAGVRPHLIVDGATGFNAEPPVYVDEAAGLIGPVDLGLPARLANRLLAAPVIPPGQLAEVARNLGLKLPPDLHNLLPAPPEPALRIEQDPVPVLHLGVGCPDAYSYFHQDRAQMPLARLSFRYGPIEVALSEKAARLEAFHDGRVYVIERQRSREKSALKRLKDFNFVEAGRIYPDLDQAHYHDVTFAQPRAWLDFLNRHAEELRADGFEIRIDEDFPYRLAKSSGVFEAAIESTGIDWFELGVGVEIDGERRDLTPMLAALISAPGFTPDTIKPLAEAGDHFYMPLADGRYLALAAERFLPIVLALHALNLSGRFGPNLAKVRLSRADIVPLLGFENRDFAFKGADSLRRLASLLHNRERVEPPLPAAFKAVLRSYQAQGVAWLDLLRESGLGGILADDMGLGKTVQILALLALEKAHGRQTDPALVIAPTSLMTNWLNEARKFTPELKVLVLHGARRKETFAGISEYDVVLTTYPLIARDHEILLGREWHMAILDEAQTIKNPRAATTRWLSNVRARHRFCLTGTPMENHLGELWSLMNFVNPGYLGDKTTFDRQWRAPIEKRGDAGRSAALAQRVKPFLLRRTKAEVATELPAKTEMTENVVLEGKQRDLYDSIRLSMAAKVRQAIADRGLAKSHIVILEALLRLRQACCDPALLKLDDGIVRPSAKLDRLIEMVAELLSEGRKIIVFSQFTSMLALIRARFDAVPVRYSLLIGETRDRKSAIDAFQSGGCDVFLISLKAGGVGLNLTTADAVIIFDPWWNPAVEEQAIDRAHRIGQDKPVFVYRLVATDTIEERMDELKARKRALADSLFDREGQIGSALTEEDVRALLEI